MNIERIDLNLLKVFVAVYEERKLTAAAERLGLTQPGLSHALKRLRDLLGDEVFVRVPRGVAPTRKAHDLYATIRDSIAVLQDALRTVSDFEPGRSTRTFVVAANDYGATVVVPPLIKRLADAAPGVTVRVVHFEHGAQYDALQRGEVDLSITVALEHPSWVSEEVLFHEHAVGVADAAAPLFRRKVTLARFAEARHVVMAPGGTTTWVDDYLAAHGLRRTVAHIVPHFLALPAAVAGTDYVATMPCRFLAPLAEAFGLRSFELPASPGHPIMQIWHRRWTADAAHAWLRRQVREAAAELREPADRGVAAAAR